MNQKHTIATLGLYGGLMEEIKIRVKSINTVLTGQMAPPFPALIAQEHCFVQLRMVCEIIAIGCIIVHNQTSRVNAFEKLWNAKDIMDRLEALNPYFFPRAVNIMRWEQSFDVHPVIPPPLTKEQFLKLYGRCGDGLHRGHLRKVATNIPVKKLRIDEIKQMADSIVNLLRAHIVSSADYKDHYICVMENTPSGPCAILTMVSDPTLPPKPPAHLHAGTRKPASAC
jgi:hypothetical protein